MSTGISISSINRIKELAEEKKYAEALEILDTQNLDKSINPQFLRISGEIFRENKRYYDSRRILLKSHQMSPQGNRIIFELIQLYLELGYYTRAKRYYEEYMFYSTPEDTQRDYVEYVMKKAEKADVKELAAILIPILERMPEDKWNFEAVLLYDKLGRKDKALEESQYILENFKNSIYIQPVIEYIDDKLDVDQYFNVYPDKEIPEDTELFGDLIAEDDRILEADHLRMYPPEARIMVEAEDKDAVEAKPLKEKKSKKKRKNKNKAAEENNNNASEGAGIEEHVSKEPEDVVQEALKISEELGIKGEAVSDVEQAAGEQLKESGEEQLKREREAALERLLSKKIDKDMIKESAKQVAKAVKDIDTIKAKSQVLSVAESVKDNVKKATDVLGEAVGARTVFDEPVQIMDDNNDADQQEKIVDGIIESVLEPPKKVVGQVLMNEELDALIPDSLEAMSAEEVADIEAKKKEAERLELEALEAALRLEEEKKKAKNKKANTDQPEDAERTEDIEEQENTAESVTVQSDKREELDNISYEELKAKFLAEMNAEEAEPLESLGFISVVQSDIDSKMEEEIPDTAGILHQMIDNKEFYSGEDSTKFESKASYDKHGFEIEDYDFESYLEEETGELLREGVEESEEAVQSVEVIYAKETIVNFDEIVPEALERKSEKELVVEASEEETVVEKTAETLEEKAVEEKLAAVTDEKVVAKEQAVEGKLEEIPEEKTVTEKSAEILGEKLIELPEEKTVVEELVETLEEKAVEDSIENRKQGQIAEESTIIFKEGKIEALEEDTVIEEAVESLEETLAVPEQMDVVLKEMKEEETDLQKDRESLRLRILLSDSMVRKLLDLKESR